MDGVTDGSAGLQAIIDTVSPLRLCIDGIALGAIRLRPNCVLDGLGFGKLIQPLNTECCVTNYHQSTGTITDTCITIRDLTIDSQSRNSTNPDRRFTMGGVWQSGVGFFGAKGIILENVSVYDPGTFHFWLANVQGARVRNLQFNDPNNHGGNRNTDGLHINGPSSDIDIDGLFGKTGDDFLAFNADDIPAVYGSRVVGGDITNCSARNLRPDDCFSVLRILTGTHLADGIKVSDVRGSSFYFGYAGDTYTGDQGTIPGNGNWGDIEIVDWRTKFTGSGSSFLVNRPYKRRKTDMEFTS